LNYDDAYEFIEMFKSVHNEKNNFMEYIGIKKELSHKADTDLVRSSVEKISSTSSIFSIQLIMEYLYLNADILQNFKGWDYRINFPGTVRSDNWSLVLPVSLEKLNELGINSEIKEINLKYGRI
jgi:4-alpha-glucanotransferase